MGARRFRSAVGRVEGGHTGTAFAVTRSLVLTAFHLVGDRRTNTLYDGPFRVRFEDDARRVESVVDQAADLDVALLRLAEPLEEDHPVLGLRRECSTGDKWRSFGFPRAMGPSSIAIDGHVVSLDSMLASGEEHARVLQLYCRQASARSALPLAGFSGAPVLVADHVVGIVRHNPTDRGAPELALGATVYAAPVKAVLERFPDLDELTGATARENRVGRLQELLLLGVADDGRLSSTTDLDAHDVGATPTKYSALGAAPYVSRARLDDRLSRALQRHGLVVVHGPSKTGKSRSTFEALRRQFPGATLLCPRAAPRSVHEILAMDAEKPLVVGELVIWMDELHHFLDQGALDRETLDLCERRRPRAVLVGTIREDRFQSRLAGEAPLEGQRLLQWSQAGWVPIGGDLAPRERDEASRLYPDIDFAGLGGIGAHLVAAEELAARLSEAEETERPAWCLVKAAIDHQRVGFTSALTLERLRVLWTIELEANDPATAPTDAAFDSALSWARRGSSSRVPMLTGPDETGHLAVLDYLEEHAADRDWQIPLGVWTFVVEHGAPDEVLRGGVLALDDLEVAEQLLGAAAEAGQAAAWFYLGLVAEEQEDADLAQECFEIGIERGDESCYSGLARRVLEEGDLEEAQRLLRRGIQAGSGMAALNLAGLHAERNEYGDARHWYAVALSQGMIEASFPLARAIVIDGGGTAAAVAALELVSPDTPAGALAQGERARLADDAEQALALFRAALEGEDDRALTPLVSLLLELDRPEAALEVLESRPEGEAGRENDLGVCCWRLGRLKEARTWFTHAETAAMADDIEVRRMAASNLAGVLADLGRQDESIVVLERAAALGSVDAMERLVLAADEDGDAERAQHWLREAHAHGSSGAGLRLCEPLINHPDPDAQERWLTEAALDGDRAAANNLGLVVEWRGDLALAEEYYRMAGPERDPRTAGNLGRVLWRRGWADEAQHWLQVAVDRRAEVEVEVEVEGRCEGDEVRLAEVRAELRERDRRREADVAAASAGDLEAALRLVEGLVEGDEEHALALIAPFPGTEPRVALVRASVAASDDDHEAAETILRAVPPDPDVQDAVLAATALHDLLLARGELRAARDVLAPWLARGDPDAWTRHGLALVDVGEVEQGSSALRRAGELGGVEAMVALATAELDDETTGRWCERAAATGDPRGVLALARWCERHGSTQRALELCRAAAAAEFPDAWCAYAELLLAAGDQRCRGWWYAAARAGHPDALNRLAEEAALLGDRDRARGIAEEAADAGSASAAATRAGHLVEAGDTAGARAWAMRAAEGGEARGWLTAGALAWQAGEHANGLLWTLRALDAGLSEAALNVGEFLHELGAPGAEDWWVRAAEVGLAAGAARLVALAAKRGERPDPAHERAVEHSADPTPARVLAASLRDGGDVTAARRWLLVAAQQGSSQACFEHAIDLDRAGDLGEAEHWYLRAGRDRHALAAYALGDLLRRRWLLHEADRWYRIAAEAGHGYAALHVGWLIESEGGDDAATWYARWARSLTPYARQLLGEVDPTAVSVQLGDSPRTPGGCATYIVDTGTVNLVLEDAGSV